MGIPPYDFHVWFKGSRKPVYMFGFDETHIKNQCGHKKPVKIKRIKLKEKDFQREPLGPKNAILHGNPEYKKAYELLRDYIDSKGGPPEGLRKKVRELWIDYTRKTK